MRMINLKSTVNKTVGVKLPEYNVNRVWKQKGQTIPLPYDTVEQMLWNEGFRNMIDRGILYIDNLQDKIDLGLEPEDAKKPENIIVVSDTEIKNLLTVSTLEQFKKSVDRLNRTQIDNIINYAVINDLVDVAKAMYLKELTGVDILENVSRKKKLEEAEKKEKTKK